MTFVIRINSLTYRSQATALRKMKVFVIREEATANLNNGMEADYVRSLM